MTPDYADETIFSISMRSAFCRFYGFHGSCNHLADFFTDAFRSISSFAAKRRKSRDARVLVGRFIVTCSGTLCAFVGIYFYSLWAILLSRIIIGLASVNISIVEATIADISTPEEKTKNF